MKIKLIFILIITLLLFSGCSRNSAFIDQADPQNESKSQDEENTRIKYPERQLQELEEVDKIIKSIAKENL